MVNSAPAHSHNLTNSRQAVDATTSVHETYEPAVVRETVKPIEREEQTVAIDRERHQDHYQTRVQPVEDHVREAERHKNQVLPTEERHVGHGKDSMVDQKLAAEHNQFRSTQTVLPTTKQATTSTVEGEHIHHHVHETVQPVIEREVVQPTVVHTTKPVHEKIEHTPTIHPATVQPKMTMEEFQAAGGDLKGRHEARREFKGEPVVRENGGADEKKPGGISGARGSASGL